MDLLMDVYGSFCIKVCSKNAETEFLKQFFSGECVNVFEVLDSFLYFCLYSAMFEFLDVCQQFVHIRNASKHKYRKM